jgi:hypothetical protein
MFVAVATFAALALAACGGPAAAPTARSSNAAATATPAAGTLTPASIAPPAGDPAAVAAQLCAAASANDVSSIMHQPAGDEYGAGVPDPYGQCTWRVGGASANNGDGQLIAAFLASPLSFIKSSFGTGGVDVDVDGHAGFWNPGQGLQTLWTDVGDGRLLVLSFDPVTDTTKTSAQVLARLFLSKI